MSIKIEDKAIELLSSFAHIDDGIILRDDYLYTKNSSIMACYELPEGEVVLDEEVGIGNIKELLTIIGFVNEDEIEIDRDGEDIIIKDASKKFTYPSAPKQVMNELNTRGVDLFDESEDAVCNFSLDETKLEECIKYSNALGAKTVYILGEDDDIFIELLNNETNSKSRIKLEGVNTSGEDFVYEVNDKESIPFFTLLYKGIYEVEIKKTVVNKVNTLLIMFNSMSINDEENGNLYYFTAKKMKGIQ